MEIVNSRIRVYTKAGDLVRDSSLAAFFGYTAQTIFDPRAIYDPRWDRYIAIAEAFPESNTVQRFFIGISKTNDTTGNFWVYNIDINTTNAAEFFDYPQLGHDQDTIIITANIFNNPPSAYLGSRVYAFSKAFLYNGLAVTFIIFSPGQTGTIAPPIVLDQNADAFLISALSFTSVNLWRLTNGSRQLGDATLTNLLGIPVPAWGVPPAAAQPTQGLCTAAANLLDTLDGRFVNPSTQIGDRLFNVHTINGGGSAVPKWYEFDVEGAGAKTIIQQGTFFATASSHDFNASIAANSARDVYVTWTAVDPAAGTEPQVRFSGRRSIDPINVIGAGSSLFNSPNGLCYNAGPENVERWGDYSAVTVDPVNPLRAWVINEKLNTNTTWGGRIGRVGY